MLALDNVELVFDESSLAAAAELAMARGTGARGLRSIIESTLLDVMFETPGSTEIRKVVVTDKVVRGEVRPLIYGEGDKRFEWQSDGKAYIRLLPEDLVDKAGHKRSRSKRT